MSLVTTHVLDTALGRPAAGVPVRLERLLPESPTGNPSTTSTASTSVATTDSTTSSTTDGTERGTRVQVLAAGRTDHDGRVGDLGPDDLEPGVLRLVFDTATYFAATGQTSFFPEVSVTFALTDPASHHHVPVLLSPFAYSTYRGS